MTNPLDVAGSLDKNVSAFPAMSFLLQNKRRYACKQFIPHAESTSACSNIWVLKAKEGTKLEDSNFSSSLCHTIGDSLLLAMGLLKT